MAIKVIKKEGESNQSLVFRFTKKTKQSGMIAEVRSRRFRERKPNKRKIRLSAIYRSQKSKEYGKMRKLELSK